MATHAEVRERPASIFMTDVALTDVARHDDDLHRGVECASLAPAHDCNYPVRHLGRLFTADPNGD